MIEAFVIDSEIDGDILLRNKEMPCFLRKMAPSLSEQLLRVANTRLGSGCTRDHSSSPQILDIRFC